MSLYFSLHDQDQYTKINRDEISYLKTLAYYTNVTLETFLKIENLLKYLDDLEDSHEKDNPIWLNRVLYKLEEKLRSEVAKDLHDSVLQDLISFQKRFERANDQFITNPVMKNEADKMMDDMSKIISTTRETCYELRPNVLYDLGLKKGIEKLVYQHENNTNMKVHLNVNNLRNPDDLDIQLNIYRITQELLNNGEKHSNASLITLILVNIKEKMVIHYEDDGKGSEKEGVFSRNNGMFIRYQRKSCLIKR
ncbi:sensor histidine kinase [Metabacillus litoralis]|uniref:sensor histidine kinase n=1 Tax=Metabacillus litoralis TaxID=152268 RepID=UPI001CFE83CC|nr:histidine kinase [Metabacillus litoralis]